MASAQLPPPPPVKQLVQQPPVVVPPPEPPETLSLPPAVASKVPGNDPISTPIIAKPSLSSSSGANVISIPSYSRWFSWDKISETEHRFLPEFFDGKSESKNPTVYRYYRDLVVRKFRENPSKKITFTEVRKGLVGDVGSIRRVFDFLESWGLINYTPPTSSKPQPKWEDKVVNKYGGGGGGNLGGGGGSSLEAASLLRKESSKKVCNGCKIICSIACFVCDQHELTLCARCYVRGNYRTGLTSEDFRRVEISEETKTDWTEKETLTLLEAVMHFGDDWKKVAEHVSGRSEKECVARFIKLPFKEQFVSPPPDSEDADKYYQTKDESDADAAKNKSFLSSPAKKRCLTPLADSSNPIMAQAAFLSAMVGSEVAEAAARAAVAALPEVDLPIGHRAFASIENGGSYLTKEAVVEAHKLLEKEEHDSISTIIEVQMKEIRDKIVEFEELELQMEKERQQLQHMKNMFLSDQTALFTHRIISNEAIDAQKGSV